MISVRRSSTPSPAPTTMCSKANGCGNRGVAPAPKNKVVLLTIRWNDVRAKATKRESKKLNRMMSEKLQTMQRQRHARWQAFAGKTCWRWLDVSKSVSTYFFLVCCIWINNTSVRSSPRRTIPFEAANNRIFMLKEQLKVMHRPFSSTMSFRNNISLSALKSATKRKQKAASGMRE